jgi:hypothetical protein
MCICACSSSSNNCMSPYGRIEDRFLCHQWMLHL